MIASENQPRATPLPGGNPRDQIQRNLTAGGLCAVVMVAYAGSCANLIFSGPLARFGSQGMLAALVSTVITVVVLSQFSSFSLSLGGPDSNPSAILAVTVTAIAARIMADSGADDGGLLPTILMFVSASAVGCGLLLILIGERQLGRCVRFIPHPVIGGFLGGTGYLLVSGACAMLTGGPLGMDLPARLAGVPPLAGVIAVVTALTLLVFMRALRHPVVFPLVLLGAAACFYVALPMAAHSIAEARSLGLLMEPLRLGSWVNSLHFPYAAVRWDLVLAHWNDFAVMTVVVIVTGLLNATGIDIMIGADVDFDRELRALGIANIVSGLAGGLPVVNSFNRTVLNHRSGANSRWAARCCAGFILLLLLACPQFVGLIPRPVLTGLILYLGLSLLLSWGWDGRRSMPVSDYLIVVSIVVIIATRGVVAGVLLGVVIACLNFVFAFSKSPAIKYRFTAANRHSNVQRKPHEVRMLRDSGTALCGFALQGFLFFGTASSILDECRRVLAGTRYFVLDFRLVREVDTSSAFALRKVRNLCVEKGVQLVITGVSTELRARFRRASFDLEDPQLRNFFDLDHGLEWCENAMIAAENFSNGPFVDMTGVLTRFRDGPMGVFLEPFSYQPGDSVVREGDKGDSLFIVESGQVSIYLQRDVGIGPTSSARRLRSYAVGTVVGEMGFYTGERRSAHVVADVQSILLRLSRDRMMELEREFPSVAHEFHRYVIFTMALRLRDANEEISLLQ